MKDGPPESDWKTFRKVRELALERMCRRVLRELEDACQDQSRSHHERFLRAWKIIDRGNEKIAEAFNNPRRSQLIWQLSSMRALNLVDDREFEEFSEQIRDKVEFLVSGPRQ